LTRSSAELLTANYYAGLPMQWRKRPKFSMTEANQPRPGVVDG
jgi:hypothetical protein